MIKRVRAMEDLIEDVRGQRSIRATSLIISVYGDAIAPRGGTVWLGSLIRALEPLGLNERLVRTSVYRLSVEGWLSSQRIGRRSYYSLTRVGWRSFERAYERVYSEPQISWNGEWTLAIIAGVPVDKRETLRKELANIGFGAFSPGVLAHPKPSRDSLMSVMQDLDVQGEIIIMHARNEGLPTSRPLNRLVRECWNLAELSKQYETFLQRYRPIWAAIDGTDPKILHPGQCFWVRTMLIHEVRRLLLRDPQLPQDVLPTDWHGVAARLLCRNLYRALYRQAEAYLGSVLETAEGPLPEPAAYFYRRFGGL